MNDHKLTMEEQRQKAIELYHMNWKVSAICSALGCSKSWLYKWLTRSNDHGETWFKERSRAPRNLPNKIDPVMEQKIVQIRNELIASPYSQYGPQAIYYKMVQQGYSPLPIWTIARTLKRHGLIARNKRDNYVSKGKTYPYVYCLCHEMDFVGPRYLSNKKRYYFLSLIDCDSHWCQTSVLEDRKTSSVCDCLLRFWKDVGIPDFLQMDNELCFWGSLREPRAVGNVIRLCLIHGVVPVFIPQGEPWRNGIVECFNRTMQNNILSQIHPDIHHLKREAKTFDRVHNESHHYSSQEGMTPEQAYEVLEYPLRPLDESYTMPEGKLPLEEGMIHIIRYIKSDRKFNVFGLSFELPEEVVHEYVKGVIFVEEFRLSIFLGEKFITDFPFELYP